MANEGITMTVINRFHQPVVARHVRVAFFAWETHLCTKVELFGCKTGTILILVVIGIVVGIFQIRFSEAKFRTTNCIT